MSVFVAPGQETPGHEQVVYCHDRSSGLRAIIAIYSTALGPALGGTRFYPYATEDDALHDVLELARGMAYKNALAGLDHGGGKAVIWGDPAVDKNESLLRAYGRFVESLNGRYVTACDVGTYVEDMDVIAKESGHVVGRSRENGGAGDSSVLTAYGVFQGMRACAQHRWGSSDLSGRLVGVAGVGKVGHHLVEHLVKAGARVLVTDVNPAAMKDAVGQGPDVDAVAPEAFLRTPMEIYSPCALGGALSEETVAQLRAEIICGAANNQLAAPGIDELLADRGILYAPDYLVNSGGVVQVADELHGFIFERAHQRVTAVYDTALEIFRLADDEKITPARAADQSAEHRMKEVGGDKGIYLIDHP